MDVVGFVYKGGVEAAVQEVIIVVIFAHDGFVRMWCGSTKIRVVWRSLGEEWRKVEESGTIEMGLLL